MFIDNFFVALFVDAYKHLFDFTSVPVYVFLSPLFS